MLERAVETAPGYADGLRPRLERTLARPDIILYVAEEGPGGVAGWILGGEQETLETGPRCEILGLVVAGPGRRRGIGRPLVAAVETWGREGWLTCAVAGAAALGTGVPSTPGGR